MSQSSGTISPTARITNLHLKQVLKTYAANAMNSLNGPGSFQESWKPAADTAPPASLQPPQPHHQQQQRRPVLVTVSPSVLRSPQPPINHLPSHPQNKRSYGEQDFSARQPPFPIQPPPIFSQPDQTNSEQSETLLEGERIACFNVGGEKRLCLPQILNTILQEKELDDINTVVDDLRIYLQQCSSFQLARLKEAKMLPSSVPSCGLITLTDAERLCGALLHRRPDQEFHIANREKCRQMPVIHRCFGTVRGTCFVDLYGRADAPCIECAGCKGMFSPRHFVLHNDQSQSMESRLCHWGFDSSNWRHYIFIPEDAGREAQTTGQPLLEELKRKFECLVAASATGAAGKRPKFGPAEDQSPFLGKRIKIEEAVYPHGGQYGPVGWFIPPMGKNLGGGNTTGVTNTPDDLSSKFTNPYVTVQNLAVVSSSPAAVAGGQMGRGITTIVGPDISKVMFQSPFQKFGDKFVPNVALFAAGKQQQQRCQTPKPLAVASPRPLSRLPESPAGNTARERPSGASTSHAPDRQRGSFLSDDDEDAGDETGPAKLTIASAAESEDESSSNSTLSIDFGQESAILEEDTEDFNNILTVSRTDPATRMRIIREVTRLKQRYGGMLLQAQHDKLKVDEELHYFRSVNKDQKATIEELKTVNAQLELDNGKLLAKVSKRFSYPSLMSSSSPPPQPSSSCKSEAATIDD